MKWWAGAGVGLLILVSHAACGSEPSIQGFVLLEPQWTDARRAPFDPGDEFHITNLDVEAAAVANLNWDGFTARARATDDSLFSHGTFTNANSLKVLELQWTGRLADHLIVSAGKRVLSWDTGYAAQPLGFFQSQVVLSDLTDEEGRAEGLPLVTATWLGNTWSVSAAASDDFRYHPDGQRRGLKQWAFRITKELGTADTALVVRQVEGASPGLGASIADAFGDYFSFHGSAFFEDGQIALTTSQRQLSDLEEPSPALTIGRLHRTTLQSVLGMVVTPWQQFTAIAEYIHNGNGLSSEEWRGFVTQSLATRERAILEPNGPADYALGRDAQAFSAGYLRRSYAFLSASYGTEKWTVGESALIDLDDGSSTTISQITYSPTDRWSLSGVLQVFQGNAHAEFGATPIALQCYLRIRRVF